MKTLGPKADTLIRMCTKCEISPASRVEYADAWELNHSDQIISPEEEPIHSWHCLKMSGQQRWKLARIRSLEGLIERWGEPPGELTPQVISYLAAGLLQEGRKQKAMPGPHHFRTGWIMAARFLRTLLKIVPRRPPRTRQSFRDGHANVDCEKLDRSKHERPGNANPAFELSEDTNLDGLIQNYADLAPGTGHSSSIARRDAEIDMGSLLHVLIEDGPVSKNLATQLSQPESYEENECDRKLGCPTLDGNQQKALELIDDAREQLDHLTELLADVAALPDDMVAFLTDRIPKDVADLRIGVMTLHKKFPCPDTE